MFDLCKAVFSMTSEELCYVYASITETNLWSALSSTASDYWSRISKSGSHEGAAFQRRIEDAIRRYKQLPDEEICLRLLSELSSALGIPFPNLVSRKDCADLCERIVREACKMYAKHHPGYTGLTAEDLAKAVIADILGQMSENVSQSPKDAEDLAAKFESFLDTLPTHQQEEIRRRLGVDKLSKSMLTKMIVQGTLGSLFAVTVEVAGFAAYQYAVVLLSSLAGLVGITLPFVAYKTLTSLIAVVANPIFLVAFIGGGGVLQYNKQNTKIREQFIPVLVAITLAGEDQSRPQSTADRRMDAVANFWQHRLDEYLRFRDRIQDISARLAEEQCALGGALERRREADKDLKACSGARSALVDRISKHLESDEKLLVQLATSGPGQDAAQRYRKLRYEMVKERAAMLASRAGLLRVLGRVWSGVVIQTKLQVQMSSALKQTAQELVNGFSLNVLSGLEHYAEESARIMAMEAEARSRRGQAEKAVATHQAICTVLKAQKRELESSQDELGRKLPTLVEVAARL